MLASGSEAATILYDSEIWPKSVGCKIVDLIVKSKSLPVEVSNSTIEFHLPVNSQYSSPIEALHLIVESKSLPVEVNNWTIELHLPVEAKEKLPIIYSK